MSSSTTNDGDDADVAASIAAGDDVDRRVKFRRGERLGDELRTAEAATNDENGEQQNLVRRQRWAAAKFVCVVFCVCSLKVVFNRNCRL